MGEAYILRRGGDGLSPRNAVVHVNAPAGSTITFVKGGITVKTLGPSKGHVNADDSTIADWFYSVSSSNYGEWTVTAAKDGKSVSKTVTVETNDTYDAKIRFEYYAFKEGSGFQNDFSMTTSDLTYTDSYITNHGVGQGSKMYLSPAVDMSKYETLYVDWQHEISTNTPKFGIYTSATSDNSFTSYVQRPSAGVRGTDTIDVSILTGNYYIKSWGNYSNNTYIYGIWLL